MGRSRSCTRALAAGALALAATGLAAPAAHAQAYVGDAGGLSAGFDYSFGKSEAIAFAPDQVDGQDTPTRLHTLRIDAEYTPIERLGLTLAVPIMMIKYTGSGPHMPVEGAWDDGNNHTTLQDGRIGARYQVLADPVAFTPHLGLTVPLSKYEYNGFAAVGRGLIQGHIGASVARTLDPILPNLYIHAMYEFTLSQKFDEGGDPDMSGDVTKDINQNRSDFAAQMGYFLLDGDLELNLAMNLRETHGGISFATFNEYSTVQRTYHDALLDEDFIFLGGGLGYAATEKLQLGAYVRFFLRGFDTRLQDIFGLNVTYTIL